ncbi:MAG: hypothetical protein M1828_001785 [Chrysothrix sp. TS-e1954]|nr:MAG: hypothetical protein M1828_001785 [Chrysothrix sp. TS-e1954]
MSWQARAQIWKRASSLYAHGHYRKAVPPLARLPPTPIRYLTCQSLARQGTAEASPSTVYDAHGEEQLLHLESSRKSVAAAIGACPGCGALAQTVHSNEAGFYSVKRKQVEYFVGDLRTSDTLSKQGLEDELFRKAIEQVKKSGLDIAEEAGAPELPIEAVRRREQERANRVPFCDRCHDLVHHSSGKPIAHPSLESIRDTISESPYRYNHIYHAIDAADFPLSLVPGVQKFLDLAPQRTKNRRSHHAGYKRGTKSELSFIITRADLLAPTKPQVDRLMPYITRVLRHALGSRGEDLRMGNVRCVSAKRGWWTGAIKSDIWKRGGGNWMVGKVNVGKSKLYENVFPKGSSEQINLSQRRSEGPTSPPFAFGEHLIEPEHEAENVDDNLFSLLPEARKETIYPKMPTVSALPGTTASPIRIPFGNGRGELIDLPGLSRTSLDDYLLPQYKTTLLLEKRVKPEQYKLAPQQSLLLGGLIRITNPGISLIMAYPFVPLQAHATSTVKALEVEHDARSSPMPFVVTDEARSQMALAGKYTMTSDVTRRAAGPLLSAANSNLKVENLPFQTFSIDILIESLGWVELVCEVRRPRRDGTDSIDGQWTWYPEVEVFSPQGKFIGRREPLGAMYLTTEGPELNAHKKRPLRQSRQRARGSLT